VWLIQDERVAHVTEDELRTLLDGLEQGLVGTDLSPLVEQERITAAEGKAEEPTAEDIEGVRQERASQGLKRTSGPRSGDVRIRPLDAGERLAQLLDLLEVAIGGSYAIETHLRQDLKTALGESSTVQIAHEWNGQVVFSVPAESAIEEGDQAEWRLPDQAMLEQREAAVRRAILLINQLRGMAGIPRSDYLQLASTDDSTDFDSDFPGAWA
jgi:hypothetical protein